MLMYLQVRVTCVMMCFSWKEEEEKEVWDE